ncbi:MAG: hypothetical protein WA421_11510 [Nitrososphaeraceae archaeon]
MTRFVHKRSQHKHQHRHLKLAKNVSKFLTQPQINTIPQVSIAFVNCAFLVNFSESEFRTILINAGVDVTIANNLIACLRDVGIVFKV